MSRHLLADAQDKSYSAARIESLRDQVRHEILARSGTLDHNNFDRIHTSDLQKLFLIYDRLFFVGGLEPAFRDPNHVLTFRLSRRMTSVGGTTTLLQSRSGKNARCEYEIAISTTVLFVTSFQSGRLARVGGLKTRHRLDALQRIFEHELVHLIELRLWGQSSCAGRRFKSIIFRFFGHRESNHQLASPHDTAREQFGVEIGDRVSFVFQGQTLTGFVNRVQQRATVLVEHSKGEPYDDGHCYLRYYVPLQHLCVAK